MRVLKALWGVGLAAALTIGLLPAMTAAPAGAASTFAAPLTQVSPGCPAVADDAYSSAVLADSPLVYYPLNESSGTMLCDASGNEDNGSYAPEGLTFGVSGPLLSDASQTAVSSTGSYKLKYPENKGDIATTPSLSGLSGEQSFTLEGWFKGSTSPNETLVALTVFDGTTNGMTVWNPGQGCNQGSDTDLALDEYYGTSTCWDPEQDGVNLRDGNWHYLAITYEATSHELTGYVDGHDLGSQETSQSFDWSSPEVLLGTWVDETVNQSFVGDAAQIAVYGTALSPARIDAHYQAAQAAHAGMQQRFTVSATAFGEGGGPGGNTVTASDSGPEASCSGANCTVNAGDTVTLTPHAAPGYVFSSWGGIGDPCQEKTEVCTISNVQANTETSVFETSVFFLYIQPPAVNQYQATSVSDTSEKITAKVEPHGLQTTYSLDYGTSTSYGQTVAGGSFVGAPQTVTFTLSGLVPGTKYNYEVLATSSGGSSNGGNATFVTPVPPAPPPPPTIKTVTAYDITQTNAAIKAGISPVQSVIGTYTAYVKWSSEKEYLAATAARAGALPNPYPNQTTPVSVSGFHQGVATVRIADLSKLTANTTYHYRVIATVLASGTNESSTTESSDETFKTAATPPTAKALPATSVSSTGATLNGTIDDYGVTTSYSFWWHAKFSDGSCGSATTTISGTVSGVAPASDGTQSVSRPLDLTGANALPEGSVVQYTMSYEPGEVAIGPGVVEVVVGPSFTTGSIPVGGGGAVDVLSDTSAILQSVLPDPPAEGFEEELAHRNYDGEGAPDYGMFEYEASFEPHPNRVGTVSLESKCGTRVTTTLTNLKPDSVYGFSPEATYGRGSCPAADQYGDYYRVLRWEAPYTHEVIVACSTYEFASEQFESGYQEGNYATRPAISPTYSPELDPAELRLSSHFDPVEYHSVFFETAATSAPSNPTINPSGGGGSDGLTCGATASCSGKQKLVYSAQAPTGGTASLAKKGRTQHTVTLASVAFKIPAHKTKLIHFRLSSSGLRYLKQHTHILAVTLVTTVHAGKGKSVTLSSFVLLERHKQHKSPRKK
jgi:hypothetical protein